MGVSVLIPVYGDRSVDKTIQSVIAQRLETYEILILHNGIENDVGDELVIGDMCVRHVYIKRKSKGHALNVGLKMARFNNIAVLDVDCELAEDAIKVAMNKLNDDVVAVGGKICVKGNGVLELVQSIEYERSFNITRRIYDLLNSNIIISGAFGVFDKKALIGIGSYAEDTVGEDMDIVLRLQKENIGVLYAPDAICYTKAPDNIFWLLRQRDRWQRGMFDCLLRHKELFLDIKYGVLGLLCIPYLWIIEFLGPIRIPVLLYLFGLTGLTYYLLYIVLVSFIGDYIEIGKKSFAPKRIFIVILLTLSGCLVHVPISLARIYGMLTYKWRKNIW